MVHNVYFWLKPDLSAGQRSTFEAELAALLNLEYLAHGAVGRPAATEKRPVTDHSFSYSLMLQFKKMQDHDFYQTECPVHKRFIECPVHKRFIETCKTFWERVVVYDSEELA